MAQGDDAFVMSEWRPSMADALQVHETVIRLSGGRQGLRDQNLLDSALNAPYQEVFGKRVHEGTIRRGAALMRALVMDHPFIDGNKRTAAALSKEYMQRNGYDVVASPDALAQTALSTARGTMTFDDLAGWFASHLQRHATRALASQDVTPCDIVADDGLSLD